MFPQLSWLPAVQRHGPGCGLPMTMCPWLAILTVLM